MSDYFITLHQEDIIYTHIFDKLSLKDFFNLRCSSKLYKDLVDNYLQQLKILDLSNYKNFSREAFKILIANSSHLISVQLRNCSWVTNDLLIPLFKNNVNITVLDLSNCAKLTPACLQPVIISCKDLKDLNLSGNHWMTNGCLEAFTYHHKNLRTLKLSDCSQISNQDTIHNLLRNFSELNHLDLSGNPSIDHRILTVIAESCPNMKYLKLTDCRYLNPSADIIRHLIESCHIKLSISKNPRLFPT